MTSDKIRQIFESIKTNILITNELDTSLHRKMDYASFRLSYIERSNILRDLYKKNQKSINGLVKLLKQDLNDETAEALYNGYRELEKEELHDSFFILQIIEKLIPYYEAKNDVARLLRLYGNHSFELSIFLMANKERAIDLKNDIYKTLELKKYYTEFTLNERLFIYCAYYNFIAYLPEYDESYSEEILGIYKEARAFYQSEEVIQVGDQDLTRKEMNLLNELLLHNFMYYLDDGLCSQMEFVDIIDEIKDTFEDEMDRDLCYAVLTYLNDQMDDLELLYYLEKYFDFFYYEASKLTFNESRDEIHVCSEKLVDAMCIIFDFLRHSYLPFETKEETTSMILSKMLEFVDRFPRDRYYKLYIDGVSSIITRKALPFVKNVDKKEDIYTRLILQEQEMTYINSIMVEKVSLSILDSMNKANDSLIYDMLKIGFKDYNDLRGYVARAARVHDVGISLTYNIVNQQIRDLLPVEYQNILLHPQAFDALFEEDIDFGYYADVIKGHHKSYDGKTGYPKEFDNTKSKYKLIIDLISIAEAIVAGTDVYGRNYHEGKNFDMVLKELKDGSNTLYNPKIVLYIEKTTNLMNELKYIVDDYRMEKRYEIYMK